MQNLKKVYSTVEPSKFDNNRYRFNINQITVSDEMGDRIEWEYDELEFPIGISNSYEKYVYLVEDYCNKRFTISEELSILRKKEAGLMTIDEFDSLYNTPIEVFKNQLKQDLGIQ